MSQNTVRTAPCSAFIHVILRHVTLTDFIAALLLFKNQYKTFKTHFRLLLCSKPNSQIKIFAAKKRLSKMISALCFKIFCYLPNFFFLLTAKVPANAPPLTHSRAIHRDIWLLSSVLGESEEPSSFNFSVTVSAFEISLVASLSLKYFLQPSQYQYSMFPSAVLVAAFAGKCLRSA